MFQSKFQTKYDYFQQVYLVIKAINTNQKFADSHFHNISRLFDNSPNFRSSTSETMRDYYYSNMVYTSPFTSFGTT